MGTLLEYLGTFMVITRWIIRMRNFSEKKNSEKNKNTQ